MLCDCVKNTCTQTRGNAPTVIYQLDIGPGPKIVSERFILRWLRVLYQTLILSDLPGIYAMTVMCVFKKTLLYLPT